MSGKKKNNKIDNGCLGGLVVLAVLLALPAMIAEEIGESYWLGLAILVIPSVGVATVAFSIVAIVRHFKKKKEAKQAAEAEEKRRVEAAEEERRRHLDFLAAPEPEPEIIKIPTSSSFSCAEEKYVNTEFEGYLRAENALAERQAHLRYLTEKKAALSALGREQEAATVDAEIAETRATIDASRFVEECEGKSELAAEEFSSMTFDSVYLTLFSRGNAISGAYLTLAFDLPDDELPLVGDFFRGPLIKTMKIGEGSALLFTPAYLLHYKGPERRIKLLRYDDLSVSVSVTTELACKYEEGDEVAYRTYLHTTKNGYADRRYNYNPLYTYVYRGKVTLMVGNVTRTISFFNKSAAERFAQAVSEYRTLITGRYASVVALVLSRDDSLFTGG